MDTSLSPTIEVDAAAIAVLFEGGMLRVELAESREIEVPLEYFPRLCDASPDQLAAYELIGHGDGIAWDALDEYLSVRGLMRLH